MKGELSIVVSVLLAMIIVAGASSSVSCVLQARAEAPKDSTIVEMMSKMNSSELDNTVHILQNFMTRRYGTSKNVDAATYIYNRLDNMPRLQVEYQSNYKNVIATLPGVDTVSNAVYLVGAHFDSVSQDSDYAPGATDDGGGVAIVLEFARIMSQYSFSHTIKFAFWNDEEAGRLGSLEYVKSAYNDRIDVSLYINFDSSCYDPDGRMILDIMSNPESRWVSEMMTNYNNIYGVNFTLNYNVHSCLSDHQSFWRYGYPAIMTHSESHGHTHTSADTIDDVSLTYAKKNGQLGMSVVASMAGIVHEVPEFSSANAILLTVLLTFSLPFMWALRRKQER